MGRAKTPEDVEAMHADLARFRKAVESMDRRTGEILTFHAVLEEELGRLIAVILPRGSLLARMGYSNSLKVFQAAYWAAPERTDSLVEFLRLFGELRNSAAHGDRKKIIDGWVTKLQVHYEAMPGSNASHKGASLEDMASAISGTLAGLTYRLRQQRPTFPA